MYILQEYFLLSIKGSPIWKPRENFGSSQSVRSSVSGSTSSISRVIRTGGHVAPVDQYPVGNVNNNNQKNLGESQTLPRSIRIGGGASTSREQQEMLVFEECGNNIYLTDCRSQPYAGSARNLHY